jgi:hypothetical protein
VPCYLVLEVQSEVLVLCTRVSCFVYMGTTVVLWPEYSAVLFTANTGTHTVYHALYYVVHRYYSIDTARVHGTVYHAC